MKRFILALLFILIPAITFAAGTMVETIEHYELISGLHESITLKLVCTADGSATFDDQDISYDLKGYYIYEVVIVPGGTGPTDDSDLSLKDSNDVDLLIGKGANQVDNATNSHFQPTFYPLVDSVVTVDVDNNSVNSASWTIYLKAVR